MSAKNLDRCNRWRNKTVGFRVSPEEDKQIESSAAFRAYQAGLYYKAALVPGCGRTGKSKSV